MQKIYRVKTGNEATISYKMESMSNDFSSLSERPIIFKALMPNKVKFMQKQNWTLFIVTLFSRMRMN